MVAVKIGAPKLLLIPDVFGPERSVFQPAVIVTLVEGERSTAPVLLLRTCLGTMTETLSFEVP